MSKIKDFLKSPLGTALCAAAACLLAVVLVLGLDLYLVPAPDLYLALLLPDLY